MSIAVPSDGLSRVDSFPISPQSAGVGELIPMHGRGHSAAEVAAFVDRMQAKVTARENVTEEVLAFGLSAKLLGRLLVYRKRLQAAVSKGLEWQCDGKLTLPLEEVPLETGPRASTAQIPGEAPAVLPREGFPKIDNLRLLSARRLLEYMQVIGEESSGGFIGIDAVLACYGFERALYQEVLEHMNQLEWAAANDLPIWSKRGMLSFPRIPKGRVLPKEHESAPTPALAASQPQVEPSGNGKATTHATHSPKPEGLREKNRREAFALFLAASEVRRRYDFSTQQISGLFGITPAKFYSYEAQFGDVPMTAADRLRRDALLERVEVAAEQMCRDIETARNADTRSVFQKILEEGHDDDYEARNEKDFSSTDAFPGTKAKIDVLAERVIRGNPLWHEDDRSSQDAAGSNGRQQRYEQAE